MTKSIEFYMLPLRFKFPHSDFYFRHFLVFNEILLQTRRLKAIAEDPAIAAEASKQPPEEDDEKDEIDDDIIITHL